MRKVAIVAAVVLGILAVVAVAAMVVVVNPALRRSSPHQVEPDADRLRRSVETLAAIQPARSIDHPESLAAAAGALRRRPPDRTPAARARSGSHRRGG